MLDAIEKTFKELIVLLFVGELVSVTRVERSHQLAELGFVDTIGVTIHSILFQVVDERSVETLFGLLLVF